MTSKTLAVLLGSLALALPASAQTVSPAASGEASKPVASPTPYDDWITALGDADFHKREEAMARLRGEGAKVLPALKLALNHSDAEVRRRVSTLLPELQSQLTLSPRRVTLKISNKPLKEVLDALGAQSGYKIEAWGGNQRTVYSFDLRDLTFWEALDRISEGAGLVLQVGYGDDRVRLQAQEAHVAHVDYRGAFRIVPTNIQHYRNLEFPLIGKGGARINRQETMTLGFNLFAEPKLPLLGLGEIKLDAAYDSDRNSMLVPQPSGDDDIDMRFGGMRGRWSSRYGQGNMSLCMSAQLNLARPSEKATSIKTIRGRIPVTLLAEQRPVVVADNITKAKGQKNKIDTTSFTIEEVTTMANKQVQVRMAISEVLDNPNDYSWMNALWSRIELHDQKGNKYQSMNNSVNQNTPGTIDITMTFGPTGPVKVGPPSKLIYYAWTTMQHEVPFEFKDLPLP